jgi:Tfp pilus assembly protein PilO
LVARLRKVAPAFGLRRQAQPDDVAAVDLESLRPELVRIEEEQLVLLARLPHRAANGVAVDVL